MTRSDKVKFSGSVALMLAGIAVVIASITLIVGQAQNGDQGEQLSDQAAAIAKQAAATKRQSNCNAAFLSAWKKASDARLPFADRQNTALISAFEALPFLVAGQPDPKQIKALLDAGDAFTGKAKSYQRAKDENPYPETTCPRVPGINAPKATASP